MEFALWFSRFFFAEYKIISLRLDSRGQNLSGVNGSHFILAEKLLQHSLFSVYEAELLKHVNSSVLIAVLLLRLSSSSAFASYCFVPFSCLFLQFCQRGSSYISLMVYVQLVVFGKNNKEAN